MATTVTLATMRRHVERMTAPEAVRALAAAYERGDTEAATAMTRALPSSALADARELWTFLDAVRAVAILYATTWPLLNAAAGLADMVARVGEWAASMGTDLASVTGYEDTPGKDDFLQCMVKTSDTMALVGSSWAERRERDTAEAAADLAGMYAFARERWGVDAIRALEGASEPADPDAPRGLSREDAANVAAKLRTAAAAIIAAGQPDAEAVEASREKWADVARRLAA